MQAKLASLDLSTSGFTLAQLAALALSTSGACLPS